MKTLRWFIARSIVWLANIILPDKDVQYGPELTITIFVEQQIAGRVQNKLDKGYETHQETPVV